MNNASAPARRLAPQETRTFFVTSATWGRRSLFQTDRMARLLIDVLQSHREKARFQLHEFVVMPDHIHILLTPAAEVSLEKCVQFIKGGFSFRAGKELGLTGEIWQSGYNERRVKDARDFQQHALYIRENPVRKHLCETPDAYAYSSASGDFAVDPVSEHFLG